MKITVDTNKVIGKYVDPTRYQNSTLRYAPPENFPEYCAEQIGPAKIMRVWITLDEFYELKTDEFFPDYDIGVARYPVDERHYPYDWRSVVPAPSGTRFEAYLTSHARAAEELLLNVRRFEREVSDGIITYEQYENILQRAIEYCKGLAPNIRYVECANEVDIRSFGRLTPEEYFKIYVHAHNVIKRLNAKNCYEIPLELGCLALAHPLSDLSYIDKFFKLLSEAELGECPVSFYSYHHYEDACIRDLMNHTPFNDGVLGMSAVAKLLHLKKFHDERVRHYGLPECPVFLDELGRALTTGEGSDALYNASALITYMNAFSCGTLGNLFPFPWCTFHNPKHQISYTQFILNDDGSYSMTPNGLAIKFLHSIHGDRLATEVSEYKGDDAEYRAIAVSADGGLDLLITNPLGTADIFELTADGLEEGEYSLTIYKVDDKLNNAVTSNADGRPTVTAETVLKVSDGRLSTRLFLQRGGFALCSIRAQSAR